VLLDRVRGRAEGLFGVSVEDVRLALRAQGTDAGYRDLVRDWFGRFVGRALQSIVDREVSNVVGGPALASPAAAEALHSELLAFAHERTRILHEFAPAWLSKAVWQEGELTPRTFRRFFGYALEKVVRDISQERPVA
jgi:hypothetical protein